jgi:hypothetical protein
MGIRSGSDIQDARENILVLLDNLAQNSQDPLAQALLAGDEREWMLAMLKLGRPDMIEDAQLNSLGAEYIGLRYCKGGNA